MLKTRENQNMSCAEAGQRGGMATLARHGIEHFQRAGVKGQVTLCKRYTSNHRKMWGKLGGRPKKTYIELEGVK